MEIALKGVLLTKDCWRDWGSDNFLYGAPTGSRTRLTIRPCKYTYFLTNSHKQTSLTRRNVITIVITGKRGSPTWPAFINAREALFGMRRSACRMEVGLSVARRSGDAARPWKPVWNGSEPPNWDGKAGSPKIRPDKSWRISSCAPTQPPCLPER